jgi:hypothetical protein
VKIGQGLRKIWHAVYYALAPKAAVDFAMRCKDVATQVSLGGPPETSKQKLRYLLHMSLCQACRNYEGYSRWLNREATQVNTLKLDEQRLKILSSRLLKAHSGTKKS